MFDGVSDDVCVLQGAVAALREENRQLRLSFERTQSTVERLQNKLRDVAVAVKDLDGGADVLNALGLSIVVSSSPLSETAVELAAESCVATEVLVRNTLGEVLFRVFLDQPSSHRELMSWFYPYFSSLQHMFADSAAHGDLELRCGSGFGVLLSELPLALVPTLRDVVASVSLEQYTKQLAYVPIVRYEEQVTDCGGRGDRHAVFTGDLLVRVSSFLGVADFTHRLMCLNVAIRRELLVESAFPVLTSRSCVSGDSTTGAGGRLFLVRPAVCGSVVGRPVGRGPHSRPLRLMEHCLHQPFTPIVDSVCRQGGASVATIGDNHRMWLASRELLHVVLQHEAFLEYAHGNYATSGNGATPPLDDSKPFIASFGAQPTTDDEGFIIPQPFESLEQMRRAFRPGAQIDVLDTVRKWYDAIILSIRPRTNEVLVHYNRWSNRWDEWIPLQVPSLQSTSVEVEFAWNRRIQPYGSRFDHGADLLQSDFAFFQVQWPAPSHTNPTESVRYALPKGAIHETVVTLSDLVPNMFQPHLPPSNASAPPHHAPPPPTSGGYRATRPCIFTSAAEQSSVVASLLDPLWQSTIIPSVFSHNGRLLDIIASCQCIVRDAEERDLLSMVETSYISNDKLVEFLRPWTALKSKAPRGRDDHSKFRRRRRSLPIDDDESGHSGDEVSSEADPVSPQGSNLLGSRESSLQGDDDEDRCDDEEEGLLDDGANRPQPSLPPSSVCRLVELYNTDTVNAFFIAVNCVGEGLIYSRYGARHWKHS